MMNVSEEFIVSGLGSVTNTGTVQWCFVPGDVSLKHLSARIYAFAATSWHDRCWPPQAPERSHLAQDLPSWQLPFGQQLVGKQEVGHLFKALLTSGQGLQTATLRNTARPTVQEGGQEGSLPATHASVRA